MIKSAMALTMKAVSMKLFRYICEQIAARLFCH